MTYESLQEFAGTADASGARPPPIPRAAPVAGVLPAGVVWFERAAAALRAALHVYGLEAWQVFHCTDLDLDDLDEHLPLLDRRARWRPLRATTRDGETVALLKREQARLSLRPTGWVRIARYDVAVARWYWMGQDGLETLWLCAAPSAAHYRRLHRRVVRLRRTRGASVWQIVGEPAWASSSAAGRRLPRRPVPPEDLLLDDGVRARVETDVIRFFTPAVEALYRGLGVPYRRGVLLYGPPGNGKTSLVRMIGAALPDVPALILRPHARFDGDCLANVLRRWRQQAPAILVIEDLDWLLERVNVSTFLNLIDGVESEVTGGLLLIATTNHPEKLDPAVNNRPGRFDVVIDVPPPDDALRRAYVARRLPELDAEAAGQVIELTRGLSFAHLQEVVHLSGLLALRDGRKARAGADVLRAAELVRGSHEDALRGFPQRCELPIGLQHIRKARSFPVSHSHGRGKG